MAVSTYILIWVYFLFLSKKYLRFDFVESLSTPLAISLYRRCNVRHGK